MDGSFPAGAERRRYITDVMDGSLRPYRPQFGEIDMITKNRHSIRLPGYDYSRQGVYFITLVTFERECLFGKIIDGDISLAPLGQIVREQWMRLPARFPNWSIDTFGIMPNHVHGILFKWNNSTRKVGATIPERPAVSGTSLRSNMSPCCDSLGAIIRAYKSAVSFRFHQISAHMELPLWQRNYYEHIIRDEADLNRIRQYILENPLRWAEDAENINGDL
jgi:REP element-mobilizing transposase RayT